MSWRTSSGHPGTSDPRAGLRGRAADYDGARRDGSGSAPFERGRGFESGRGGGSRTAAAARRPSIGPRAAVLPSLRSGGEEPGSPATPTLLYDADAAERARQAELASLADHAWVDDEGEMDFSFVPFGDEGAPASGTASNASHAGGAAADAGDDPVVAALRQRELEEARHQHRPERLQTHPGAHQRPPPHVEPKPDAPRASSWRTAPAPLPPRHPQKTVLERPPPDVSAGRVPRAAAGQGGSAAAAPPPAAPGTRGEPVPFTVHLHPGAPPVRGTYHRPPPAGPRPYGPTPSLADFNYSALHRTGLLP